MIHSMGNRATTGKVLALAVLVAVMAAMLLAAAPAHASTTFTVNSTEDHADANLAVDACDTGYDVTGAGGQQVDECTLRAAINQANYTPGYDTINFAIPGSGVNTIAPTSDLPEITGPVTINGYSQPGAKPNTLAAGNDAVLKIELSGASYPGTGPGLQIEAANSTVKGLVVNRWYGGGIHIYGSFATGNKVTGNYVGTDASGTQDLGNTSYGVGIFYAPNNTVGGTEAGARNVISANNGDGVQILGNNNASGNRVLSNSIFSNGDLGIDLINDGVTPNDPADKDIIGANDLQNFPVLTSAKTVSGKTTITGTLNSIPVTIFTLQLFANPSGDEGRKFIGQKVVSTNGSGNTSFTFSPAQAVGVGQTITATATDNLIGNTSEFSAARKVVAQ